MQEKKITPFNDNFDTKLFGKVIRNNLPWLFLFAVIAFTMAFLYLRYTYPIYESKSIIQIALADKNSRMLLEKDLQLNTDLPSKVELLKSSTFLERVFNKLQPYVKNTTHYGVLFGEEKYSCPSCSGYNIGLHKRYVTQMGTQRYSMYCKSGCGEKFTISHKSYQDLLTYKIKERNIS